MQEHASHKNRHKLIIRRSIVLLLCFLFFALALHNLAYYPPPWFDEGWGLSLARNWVTLGHYGHLLLGEPVPSTILNTGFPAIVPMALSFRFLGIGIWQGRLPSVLFLFGSCALLYHVAQRIYGYKVGVWTLVVILLLPMHLRLHPVFMGRQALGEMAGIFYLLLGYSLLFSIWYKKSVISILLPSLSFGLALQTKPQFFPFFTASLLIVTIWLALQHRWQEVRILSLTLVFSLGLSSILSQAPKMMGNLVSSSQISGGDPYAMTRDWNVLLTYVVVLDPVFRVRLLVDILLTLPGFWVILGVICVGKDQVEHLRRGTRADVSQLNPRPVWALLLWIFVVLWFCWFIFLSIGFLRHLFPGFLLGSIFAARTLQSILLDFDLGEVFRSLARSLHIRRINARNLKLFFSVVFLLISSIINVSTLGNNIFTASHENTYLQVLEFLNTETPPTAMIETYESELFMLLERDYHYPPDSVQHAINRKFHLQEDIIIDYDPMVSNMDYVVVGMWDLYAPLLESGSFVLVYKNTKYSVYRRVFPSSIVLHFL